MPETYLKIVAVVGQNEGSDAAQLVARVFAAVVDGLPDVGVGVDVDVDDVDGQLRKILSTRR